MALDDEAVRHTLLWLSEQVVLIEPFAKGIGAIGYHSAPCSTCGHDRRDHVVGGDADNPTPWPCNFPHSRGAPAIICYCGDYQPLTDEEP